jgi:hypothetical protein
MSIQNIVNVQISRQTSVPSRAGFGTGAFLANDTTLSVAAKAYGSVSEMTDDAELTGSEALNAGAAYFGQQVSPPVFTVIKEVVGVAQQATFTFSADLITDNSITMTVDGVAGTPVAFTTDHDTTMAAIASQMDTDFPQITTVVTGGAGSRVLTSTAAVADTDFSGSGAVTGGASQATVAFAITVAAGGIANSLAAAVAVLNDWYALTAYTRDAADIEEISDWVQAQGSSNPKLYFAQSSDSDILESGVTTDIASKLQSKAAFRTAVSYHSDDTEYMECAWIGGQLPFDPGSIVWAYKTLSLVTVDDLTDGQKAAAHGKACNTYTTEASINITEEGKVSDNPFEWIDVIRGVDWLQVNITADLFTLLVNLRKLPFDSKGLGTVKGTIQNRLTIAQTQGILSSDVRPTVFVPDLADIPAEDKANRTLNGVTFTGVLAGAIQKINVLGTVTL